MSMTPTSPWAKAARAMSLGGWVTLALSLLTLGVVVPYAVRAVRAWRLPAPSAFVAKDDTKNRAAQYASAFEGFVKQLDGRSLYYKPSPPGSEGEQPVEVVEDAAPEEAPARYEGPAITAIVLDTVWFADGQRVRAGTKGSGDLEVLQASAPWGARVKWRGGEFAVPFFERDKVIFKDSKDSLAAPLVPSADSSAGPSAINKDSGTASDQPASPEKPDASAEPVPSDSAPTSSTPSSPTPSTTSTPAPAPTPESPR
jgi:hypothetical protein